MSENSIFDVTSLKFYIKGAKRYAPLIKARNSSRVLRRHHKTASAAQLYAHRVLRRYRHLQDVQLAQQITAEVGAT
jgi:hypothetical protein